MTNSATINVARQYHPEPAGRVPEDGPYNGQRFRTELLTPAIRTFDCVIVDFDGTEGYGSSFLEEAFGGLIRKEGFNKSVLDKKLRIVSAEDPTVVDEVAAYIDQAWKKLQKQGE